MSVAIFKGVLEMSIIYTNTLMTEFCDQKDTDK